MSENTYENYAVALAAVIFDVIFKNVVVGNCVVVVGTNVVVSGAIVV